MKAIKVKDVTGRGYRRFIHIIPATKEEAVSLVLCFDGKRVGNGCVGGKNGICSFDPEYVGKWLNDHLFGECLEEEDIEKIKECLLSLVEESKD